MKTSLTHLPESKQQELHRVTQLIVETIAPEKIILYGSYATGEWQEDRYAEKHLVYGYDSDYDLLVVTKAGDRRKDYEITSQITNFARYRAPVNVITHDIDYINNKLSIGQYFFTEIVQQGVLLYDAGNVQFAEPRQLSSAEKKAIAQQDYIKWFQSANEFLKGSKFFRDEESLKISVFILHQAAERFYDTILLVFTGYKPKTHNLEKLRNLSKPYSLKLYSLFPKQTKDEEHLFSLLQKGYIDARYNDSYTITEPELISLIERVEQMKNIVKEVCEEQINAIT